MCYTLITVLFSVKFSNGLLENTDHYSVDTTIMDTVTMKQNHLLAQRQKVSPAANSTASKEKVNYNYLNVWESKHPITFWCNSRFMPNMQMCLSP